ncbi:class I SAM-dependent methyltransferase [Nocardioides marmorisolisilvae]|uniref:Class I SAM-dependent methyltransferase n=1 Tax=Nocardioides marmorisolisilvae TaxID=1542737 RepID=A0A3N0DZC8_9ACTN|nr:class I SAM-dependent methyltransferase [Nocardioides marmorisolisilvae]RNL80954.1 class I SAM-dependent methyltransferase [Nocardioides marmorisolisilvae]
MDLDAFEWLLTEPGQRLLESATAAPEDPLRASAVLRKQGSAEHVAAALTQVDLRRRATEKFGPSAARMYFTPDGLEQATRLTVARHRAARLVAAEVGTAIDLGCGIGGDLIATAEAGITVAGVDLDPVRVAVARANLAALGLPGAVAVSDATTVDHSGFDVAFADPARRSARGRSFSVDDWTPPWPFVLGLLERNACVKVAPGIPHELIPEGVEAEWVSDHGEVKEAALWSGGLASAARRATVIGEGGLATLTEEDDPGAAVREVGEFLYEPDGAVIRAGLVTAVAEGVGGGLVDEHIAYVTGDAAFRTPFARGYRVREELPYREKQLRGALRERGIGRLTIKKRGVAVVPDELRKRLALSGDAEGTIVLTRVAGQGVCLLVEPF